MISSHTLERMSQQNIETIDRAKLEPLSSVQINTEQSQAEKVLSYLDQIKNPYCFLSGETPVKVCFSEDGRSIDHALIRILQQMGQT